MTIRVVQWATGITGRMALKAVIEAQSLELVGVRVYDSAKVGLDAGDIAGTGKTGVLATDSNAAILALKPDVCLYMGIVERQGEACIKDIEELLEAGINVVSTGSSFTDVRSFIPEWGDRLDAAARKGGSTMLGAGLYPGFYGEMFVPLLSRLAFKCTQIIVRESLDYSTYASAESIFAGMGYGQPPVPEGTANPRASRPNPFTGTATIIAKMLGLKVNSFEPYRITRVTDKELQVAAGTVPAGTIAAQKIGVRAQCDNMSILVEHVTWLGPDVAPDWSTHQGYEIEFDGEPSLRLQMLLGTKGEHHTDMGCLATAMHAVHAIPTVLEADPGLIDLADVPGFLGQIDGNR
jgi:hypothetical protein